MAIPLNIVEKMPSTLEKPSNAPTFTPTVGGASSADGPVRRAAQSANVAAEESGSKTAGSSGSSAAPRAQSQVERAAEKLYEERMEDEYAKREGGA
ncbi:MAG: hypothetical protein M1832_004871 [Thelocarpon impressellum]|nr:MAG: hypothetical protein M1832_004871 [Thelocarpon impressellum]